jgi:hypothetical protein
VTVNNALQVTVDPRKPVKGQSAFETDLCVFERRAEGLEIPRVVMEFKSHITTHDVITYSAKARKHKQVYPYLRYGIIMAAEKTIPGRLFVHNEALDFGLAVLGVGYGSFAEMLGKIIEREVEASRQLEEIAFSKPNAVAFYSALTLHRAETTESAKAGADVTSLMGVDGAKGGQWVVACRKDGDANVEFGLTSDLKETFAGAAAHQR